VPSSACNPFGLASFTSTQERATFPLATIPGQHLRVRHFTIIFSGRRNVRAVRFE
jgi:hypothetical protein